MQQCMFIKISYPTGVIITRCFIPHIIHIFHIQVAIPETFYLAQSQISHVYILHTFIIGIATFETLCPAQSQNLIISGGSLPSSVSTVICIYHIYLTFLTFHHIPHINQYAYVFIILTTIHV